MSTRVSDVVGVIEPGRRRLRSQRSTHALVIGTLGAMLTFAACSGAGEDTLKLAGKASPGQGPGSTMGAGNSPTRDGTGRAPEAGDGSAGQPGSDGAIAGGGTRAGNRGRPPGGGAPGANGGTRAGNSGRPPGGGAPAANGGGGAGTGTQTGSGVTGTGGGGGREDDRGTDPAVESTSPLRRHDVPPGGVDRQILFSDPAQNLEHGHVDPSAGPAGTTFWFTLPDASDFESVDLFLYERTGEWDRGTHSFSSRDRGTDSFNFRAELGSVTADGQGVAVFQLPTLVDDPAGSYCVFRRGADGCVSFDVT